MSVILSSAMIAGLAFGSPLSAIAPDDNLAAIQKRAEQATNERISVIDRIDTRVDRSTSLSDAHRATIVDTLAENRSAMNEIQSSIAAETNTRVALESYRDIFTEFRIYAVVAPKSFYAMGADRLTETAIPRLNKAYTALEEAGAADEDLQELRAEIDEAQLLAVGIADSALAVTPADFNADSTALADVRLQLREATAAARDAVQLARDIRAELR